MSPCAGLPFQFESTGSLATARFGLMAALLSGGKVLVAARTTGRSMHSADSFSKRKSGSQSHASRLNLLLQDLDASRRYEVESLLAARPAIRGLWRSRRFVPNS